MIEIKLKKCKGSGQATNSGCGREAIKRTYGLCDPCYYNWLTTTEPGRVKLHKATLKGKSIEKRKRETERKAAKEKLKTHKDYLQDLQKVFNTFIRKRDEGKPCISCGCMTGKRDAGHMFSVGGNPELRFDEDNTHSQCVYCNQHQHGAIANYMLNLPNRIGKERFDALIERRGKPNKLSIPEIQEKIKYYKNKIRTLA